MLSRARLCDPTDCGPPGSSVRGIPQERLLEWVPISSSGDLPDPRIRPRSVVLHWQADSLPLVLLVCISQLLILHLIPNLRNEKSLSVQGSSQSAFSERIFKSNLTCM